MAAREWTSLVAGLVLAGAGVAAFAAASPREAAPVPPGAPAAVASAPALEAPVTTPTPDPGLSGAVASVLARSGSLQTVDPAAFGIPAGVARVLSARGVVLRVARPAAGATLFGGRQ